MLKDAGIFSLLYLVLSNYLYLLFYSSYCQLEYKHNDRHILVLLLKIFELFEKNLNDMLKE